MIIRNLITKIVSSSNKYPSIIVSPTNSIYTCINAYKYHIVRKNLDLYEKMDGIFVDGIFMCWLLRLIWGKKIKRLSFDMTSMAKDTFKIAEDNKKTIFFIGDQEDKIKEAIKIIKKHYPNLEILGWHSGFFSDNIDRENEIERIINLSPDYTVVGMGGLIQERFLYDMKQKGFHGIGMTCGGFFHQTTDRLNYYPDWINKYNLRSPYRVFKEGTYKRLLHVLISFPLLFIADSITTYIKSL